MAIIDTASNFGNLHTFYTPPGVNAFDSNSFVIVESSLTRVLFEAPLSGRIISAELLGNFSSTFPVGTSVLTTIDQSTTQTISRERVYIDKVLIEDRQYLSPALAEDVFFADIDSTSVLYAKLYSGNDLFIGSTRAVDAKNDEANGYAGNDKFYGYGDSGSDLFNGGSGIDTSVYRGAFANYTMTKEVSFFNPTTNRKDLIGLQVKDNSGLDGMDGLVNVERLQFTDTNIALDVGPTQNAGSVYMIYKAAFNRPPDVNGMGYWLAQKDGGSNIVTNIAQGFVNSAEFTAKYGANPSNASYVDKLYQNVLGRAGEAGGVAYWNQELDAGKISKAAVLVQFATLAEGASNVASLIANGIPYTEFVG